MAKASRGDDQYMLRFPEGLRDRIKTAADLNGRSMNSEIVARLEKSFEDAPSPEDLNAALVLIEQMRDQVTRHQQHLSLIEEETRRERDKLREERNDIREQRLRIQQEIAERLRLREERIREREERQLEKAADSRETWKKRIDEVDQRTKQLDEAIERMNQREREFAKVISSLSKNV